VRLFWYEVGQSSFQAALQLGLKRHFSGRVDHLQATVATEPQPGAEPGSHGASQRKTFLYLFDSVPGGTGYLRQLVENGGERLQTVLHEAAAALQACPCHDGCYRCLYAYRSRFQRERISKSRAMEQWKLLSEHWPFLQASQRSLTTFTITTQVESELEERFIDALREGKGAPDNLTVRLNADTWKGDRAYRLQVEESSWILQPQVDLGPDDGVDVSSRCDFLLTPTTGGRPIAIYTDGWEYHRGRLALDAQQRHSLQRSGRFRFWSLTWADVVDNINSPSDPLPCNGLLKGLNRTFRDDPSTFAGLWFSEQRLGGASQAAPEPRWLQESNSLQWLMAYLSLPSETLRHHAWQGIAQTFCLAQMGEDLSSGIPSALLTQLEPLGLLSHLELWRQERQSGQAGAWLEQAPGLMALNCIDLQAHGANREDASFRVMHLDLPEEAPEQEQQQAWREWLRQGNLFQFLPHMLLTTTGYSGFEAPSLPLTPSESLPSARQAPGASGLSATAPPSPAWREVLTFAESYAKEVIPLLAALQSPLDARGLQPPEVGYEIEGQRGEIIAELPMAWPDHCVAVLAKDQVATELPLEGWRFFTLQSAVADLLEAFQP
ncbi:MAG: DUF1998 domain-containing protein, partial [Cyanobacteriota bacterium]